MCTHFAVACDIPHYTCISYDLHVSKIIALQSHERYNKPLPIFFIDLKQGNNNKDIYTVKRLLHSTVIFEAPRRNREIPQCIRCQGYGHTKNFCYKNPRCVKCRASHLTKDCPRKTIDSDVRCVNCNGNHPANYRGCTVHKQLQEKMYPKLRQKYEQPAYTRAQKVQPGTTYSQCINTAQTTLT
jgi:hypothetical protein